MRFLHFDRYDNPLDDLAPYSAKHTRDLKGAETLEMSLSTPTNSITKGDRIVFANPEIRELVVVSTKTVSGANGGTFLVCKGAIQELEDRFIDDQRNRGATAEACLTKLLEGTRWSVGTATGTMTLDMEFYHVSALDAINELSADSTGFGVDVVSRFEATGPRITKRIIDIPNWQIEAPTQRFDFGINTKSVTRTVDATGIKTRLYGFGKAIDTTAGGTGRKLDFSSVNNGKKYVDAPSDVVQRWGIPGPDGAVLPSEGVFEAEDIDDPTKLLNYTKAELQKTAYPTIKYEVQLANPKVSLGEWVAVVDASFTPTLRLTGRITKTETDLLSGQTTVSIGNTRPVITS